MRTAILRDGPLKGQSVKLPDSDTPPLWLDLSLAERTVRYLLSPESVSNERMASNPTEFDYEYYPADELKKMGFPPKPWEKS